MTGIWLGVISLAASGPHRVAPLVGRRAGQILARHELGKISITERILRALARFFGVSANAVPSGWFGLVVLGILVALLVIVIFTWARPARRSRIRGGAVISGQTMTSRDYRKAAKRFAESGQYGEAIVEGVRAIAAELDERGILPPRVGRTARELAAEAGGELPALAADLRSAMKSFDDIRYGDRPGTRAGYDLVCRVDASVQAARSAAGPDKQPALTGPALPR
ncbi:MAG TPA: DUF4129 domain-containing protein [Streptosporangiaceae bacterium]|nr:DUF4129 domain-containing protein [Streptosporangiaceae bacterium]